LVLQDGATHYWRLGEAGGTVATNFASPGTANGTYTNVLLGQSGPPVGQPDTAASFNGSTNTCVAVGNIGTRPTRGTIEFWMYPDVVEDFRNPLSTAGASGANTGFRFELRAGGSFILYAGNSGGYETLSFGTVAATNWYHVVLTWDTSITNLTGYLNGTRTVAGAAITNWVSRFSTFNNVELGRGFSTARAWKGRLDEVAFYGTNLSATAVSNHYNHITGIGRYTNGVALGQTGALPWSPDKAAAFDGVDDHVAVGNIGARPTRGTVEFWMYPFVVENYRNPLSTSGASGANTGFRFEETTGGGFRLYAGTGGTYESLPFSGTIVASNWYHVAVAWDSSTTNLTAYLNGTPSSSPAFTNWVTRFNTFNNVELGRGFDSNRAWKGRLDEVAFYGTNLSTTVIREHYRLGIDGPPPPSGTMIRIH
jgi:hypothetical protein